MDYITPDPIAPNVSGTMPLLCERTTIASSYPHPHHYNSNHPIQPFIASDVDGQDAPTSPNMIGQMSHQILSTPS